MIELPAAGFGRFVAAIPQLLGIGKLQRDDGSLVSGVLREPAALEGAAEVTRHGGWRNYLASKAADA